MSGNTCCICGKETSEPLYRRQVSRPDSMLYNHSDSNGYVAMHITCVLKMKDKQEEMA